MKKLMSGLLLCLLSFIATAASADVTQEQQARELARAAAVAAAKADGAATRTVLQEPARSYFEWGVILSPQLQVMSVKPGSVAASMEVQVGDILVGINSERNLGSLTEVLAHLAELEHGQPLQVSLQRGDQELAVTGTVTATVVPGWRLEIDNELESELLTTENLAGCGRISIFQHPPESRELFPVSLADIDGDTSQNHRSIIKLPVGEHTIHLYEQISSTELRRSRSLKVDKPLTITIEANKQYHLAAEFLPRKRFERSSQDYWQPVVWKVTERQCDTD